MRFSSCCEISFRIVFNKGFKSLKFELVKHAETLCIYFDLNYYVEVLAASLGSSCLKVKQCKMCKMCKLRKMPAGENLPYQVKEKLFKTLICNKADYVKC